MSNMKQELAQVCSGLNQEGYSLVLSFAKKAAQEKKFLKHSALVRMEVEQITEKIKGLTDGERQEILEYLIGKEEINSMIIGYELRQKEAENHGQD